jgi:hypothetical protein
VLGVANVITRSGHQNRSYATGTDVRVKKIHAFFCVKKPMNEKIDCKYVSVNSRITIKGKEKKHDVCGLDINGSEYYKERSVTIMARN